eukprot:scaffold13198_cov94-Skeletonema_dohrnii-CCMP3373.AAC.6
MGSKGGCVEQRESVEEYIKEDKRLVSGLVDSSSSAVVLELAAGEGEGSDLKSCMCNERMAGGFASIFVVLFNRHDQKRKD